MSEIKTKKYYAKPSWRIGWPTATAVLIYYAVYLYQHNWYFGVAICLVWILLALSWAINLNRTPIVAIEGDQLRVLERMVFGSPHFLVVGRDDIREVGSITKTGVELLIKRIGPRSIGLKQLSKADREAVKKDIQRFVEGVSS